MAHQRYIIRFSKWTGRGRTHKTSKDHFTDENLFHITNTVCFRTRYREMSIPMVYSSGIFIVHKSKKSLTFKEKSWHNRAVLYK